MICKNFLCVLPLCLAGVATAGACETRADTEPSNQRPQCMTTVPRSQEQVIADYIKHWQAKVMRLGNLNYPKAARGKIFGDLIMTVEMRPDGDIEKITINRPAESNVLNEAAERAVRLGVRFQSFKPIMARDLKICTLTSLWKYTNDELTVDMLISPEYSPTNPTALCKGMPGSGR